MVILPIVKPTVIKEKYNGEDGIFLEETDANSSLENDGVLQAVDILINSTDSQKPLIEAMQISDHDENKEGQENTTSKTLDSQEMLRP